MTTTRILRNFWISASTFAVCMALLTFVLGCQPQAIVPLGFLGQYGTDDDQDEEQTTTKENENDLLKDWEKPLFALFVTGRQSGYIEPCGCTGLYNQKGGLMRRHRVMQILQKRDWELLPVDTGNQIRRFGQQPVRQKQCEESNQGRDGTNPHPVQHEAVLTG